MVSLFLCNREIDGCLHVHVAVEGESLVHSKHLHQLVLIDDVLFDAVEVTTLSLAFCYLLIDSDPLGDLFARHSSCDCSIDIALGRLAESFLAREKVHVFPRVQMHAS